MSTMDDRLELESDDFHACAPGLDPYHEPKCPHPWHDSQPRAWALRSHTWVSYVEKQENNLSWIGGMCDRCGQIFRRVYFYDLADMWCPEADA